VNKAFSNIWIIVLGALILVILVGVGAFYLGKLSTPPSLPLPTQTPAITSPTPIPTPIQTPTLTPMPVLDEISAIKLALINKLGIEEENLDFKISDQRTKWAKGMVKDKRSEVGGGYFIAAKVDGGWVIVYDGQATPTCSQIAPYNFPTDMVPECLGPGGSLVKR
jgi:hypothetical protein